MTKIYRSKTMWFNFISFALVVIPLFSAYVVGAGFGEHVAGQIAGALSLLTAVGNAAIRFFWTSTKIEGSPDVKA